VVERSNMQRAYSRVKQNKGAPGVDGMSVKQLGGFLRAHWPVIKERLLEGSYKPKPVKRVAIPKTSGGLRPLGIPTVLDRLIQQALHQVLSPLLEPEFSESSFGFRPGRSAHQAVLQARQYQHDGKRWVVDMDLAQFFDEVNHEKLMAKMGRKVKDWRVKKLIPATCGPGCCQGVWYRCNRRARRRAVRCHRFCRISCLMSWTMSWNGAGTAFVGMPTTVTFTLAAAKAASG
jgi:RNA-directed DNA polymerase